MIDRQRELIMLSRAAREAVRAYGAAEWQYLEDGGESFAIPEGTVTVVRAQRTTVDLKTLANLISGSLFRTVTVRKLDLSRWRTQVSAGKIPPDIRDKVESTTFDKPYLRVTLR